MKNPSYVPADEEDVAGEVVSDAECHAGDGARSGLIGGGSVADQGHLQAGGETRSPPLELRQVRGVDDDHHLIHPDRLLQPAELLQRGDPVRHQWRPCHWK